MRLVAFFWVLLLGTDIGRHYFHTGLRPFPAVRTSSSTLASAVGLYPYHGLMISSVRSMEGGVGTNIAGTADAAPREIPFPLHLALISAAIFDAGVSEVDI